MIPSTTSGRWLAGIGIGVAALVVVSLIVTLAAGSGTPDLLPEGSPEGTVQRYILALDDGDYLAAYAMLDVTVADECTQLDFVSRAGIGRGDDVAIRLESVRPLTDVLTEVIIRFDRFTATPPFDFSERDYEVRFLTRQESGEWRIVDAPWPFHGCAEVRQAAPPSSPTATPTPTPEPVES